MKNKKITFTFKNKLLILFWVLISCPLLGQEYGNPNPPKSDFDSIGLTVHNHSVSHTNKNPLEPIKIDNLFPGHGLTDPHVWEENGRLYLFAGHDASWKNDKDWIIDRWEIWSTDNMYDWKYESSILPEQTYMGKGGNCWAGDIMRKGDKYYWYFSNKNNDIGVMVSDQINKGYKDALGKPLIEKGIVPVNTYDPEVFEVDGKHYIIFGGRSYYIAQLADDMISLAEAPRLLNERNGDKPTLFKRNDIYYLFWDNTYATADNINGPYTNRRRFVKGGHGCAFEWKGQWYTVLENDDVSQFYRGMSLKPLNFEEDGTVIIPENDEKYPSLRRDWNFEHTAIGWFPIEGTTLNWYQDSAVIKGDVNGNAILQTNYWLMNEMKGVTTLRIRMKNNTSAKQARVYISTFDKLRGWRTHRDIDWKNEYAVTFDLSKNSNDFVDYEIKLDNSKFKSLLKKIRLDPALNAKKGQWEIDSISLY